MKTENKDFEIEQLKEEINELIDYADIIEFHENVEDAVFELEDLVDDLKSYQFKKNMNMIDLNVDELIEEVIEKINETIKKIEW